MASLSKITIRGFKSIRDLQGFDLRPLNVLIGANGAGKSNFMSLFHMMSALVGRGLQLYVQEHDGPDALLFGTRKRTREMGIEVHFGSSAYALTLRAAGARMVFIREEVRTSSDPAEPTLSLGSGHDEAHILGAEGDVLHLERTAMASWRVYHFRYTSTEAPVRQAHPLRDNLLLKPDAANLAPFLRHLRERYADEYNRIVETVRMVAPFFGDFVYRRDPGERVELEWFEADDPDTPLSPRQLSDGTLRFICLATLLLEPIEFQPDTILIDEPELGLHPYALAVLAALFRQTSSERQLIVSTQSADLINELEPNDVVVVSRRDGGSVFERLEEEPLQEWLADYTLGELWKSNVIGGRPGS